MKKPMFLSFVFACAVLCAAPAYAAEDTSGDFADVTEEIVYRDDGAGILQSSISYDDLIDLWMATDRDAAESSEYLFYAPLWYLNDEENQTWVDFYFDYIPENRTDGCTEISYYAGSSYFCSINSGCSHGVNYNVRICGLNNGIEDIIEDDGSKENSPEMVTVTCALASFLDFVQTSTTTQYSCNLDDGKLYVDDQAVGTCGTKMSEDLTSFYYYAVAQLDNAWIIWNAWPLYKDDFYLIDNDGTRFIALSALIFPKDVGSLSDGDQAMLQETLTFLDMENYGSIE